MVADGASLPADLVAHLVVAAAACDPAVLRDAEGYAWPLEPERIICPVRVVWGTADRVLPWPAAARRLTRSLPHADWVVLDGVGHDVQLDDPYVAADLIAGWSA